VIVTIPLASDTSPTAARAQLDLLRAAGPARRAAVTASLSHAVIALSRSALRIRMAGASERQVLLRWVALTYGDDLYRRLKDYLETRGR
jgi:hypothetical protein